MEKSLLDKKVTFGSMLRFTMPTIITMVFLSMYTIVDGIFVSRCAGEVALSATNIAYPVINIVLGISIMFATGGSAIVARLMGQNKEQRARSVFTAITIIVFLLGVVILVVCLFFLEPIIYLLGATEELFPFCYDYLFTILLFTPISILKTFFDYFLVTAGRPQLGLINGIIGGVINILLDYIFMVPMEMGIRGAALGTALGMLVPTLISLYYFGWKKETLYFSKPIFQWKTILQACTNGSSEMVTEISSGISTFLFNYMMLKYIGVDGVGAITIVLYAQFLLTSVFLGFSSGVAPLISFNYGKENYVDLHKLLRYGYFFIAGFAVVVFILSQLIAPLITSIFTDTDSSLFEVTVIGFRIYSIGYLFQGFNIFTSGLFTALSKGIISAIVSFLRSLGFFVLGISILPLLFQVTGIWIVVPMAEACTILFAFGFYHKVVKTMVKAEA